MENISKEYGRVSALKNTKWNKSNDSIEIVYLPQIEIIEYCESSGNIKKQYFVVISYNSNIVDFKSEIAALNYAIEARDDFNNK